MYNFHSICLFVSPTLLVEHTNILFILLRIMRTLEPTDSKLRDVLNAKGITPAEFGRMMGGMKSQTVNNWLKRGVPHSKVQFVSQKLGVSVSDISQSEVPVSVDGALPAPTTVEEYLARYGDQWRGMPIEELTKLMAKLSERISEAVTESKIKNG